MINYFNRFEVKYGKGEKMYYVYMIRCKDNSIYTGITTDLKRRMDEHFGRNEKCAKYTFNHDAIKLEYAWETDNRAMASKLEYHIKALTKAKKELLIENKGKLESILGEKIDVKDYRNIGNKGKYFS